MIASVPNVYASYFARVTPQVPLKSYERPNIRSSTPGSTASNDPSAIQNMTSSVETQIPTFPNGCTYGRCTPGYRYRSFSAVGKIQRYEISVVEIAIVRTT